LKALDSRKIHLLLTKFAVSLTRPWYFK
jgi:predicted Zn-dependent peptidase